LILVDANLLLYAYNSSSEEHDGAMKWVEAVFSGSEPVALVWPVLLAFIRISTNARAFPKPLSRAEAMIVVSEWLDRPQTVLIVPGDNHWDTLQRVSSLGKVSGPLFSDAHLAALAIEHGATLYTTDRDFARFPNLRFENPLDQKRDQ
jgi:toxin-antitoxin system PIN domain toxin